MYMCACVGICMHMLYVKAIVHIGVLYSLMWIYCMALPNKCLHIYSIKNVCVTTCVCVRVVVYMCGRIHVCDVYIPPMQWFTPCNLMNCHLIPSITPPIHLHTDSSSLRWCQVDEGVAWLWAAHSVSVTAQSYHGSGSSADHKTGRHAFADHCQEN